MKIPQSDQLVTVCVYFSTSTETVRFSKTQKWEDWKPTFEKISDLQEWIRSTARRESSEIRELVIGDLTIKISIQRSHKIIAPGRLRFEMKQNYRELEDQLVSNGWREVRPQEIRFARRKTERVA